ncbi:MAG TPA: amidohydrolase family protein [Acidimicrobiia bacterium]|nr:amidohydrolase family protein [Acidimicrobiia bacterium]
MTGDLLVRGGALVDGTGAPARDADVRIRDGVVTEVGAGLVPDGETVVDATGAYVAPGFIDCHTHYDPSLWWDPLVDPMPQHGVTTVVTGNCSLSLTPVRARDRVAASDVFGFIEDIPVEAFTTGIPWTWESYAEWRDALQAHGTAVNVAALIGHSNLRVYVMGDDAWHRAATPEERARLSSALAESLAAGALGLSTSFIDQDRHGHAVPSRAADDDELRALVEVLGAAPGHARVLEFLPWIKELDRQLVDIDRVARWCGAVGVSCTWNQLAENSRDPSRAERILEQAHALHADGCRVFGQVSPRPFDLHVSFDQTPAFVAVPAWGRFVARPTADEKRATLADPEWRAAARTDWDRVGDGFTIFPVSRLDRVRLTAVRDGEEQFRDGTFADVVAARGGHPSDVLADWVLEHDLAPGMVAEALSNNDAEKVSALIADATTVVGASDAGAHLQMMCGAGDSTLLLTEHVRDRGDLSVEQGVHQMTGRIAEVFGIRDRGVLAPGRAGDVVVFALDELDYRADRTVHDLPGGAPRLTRPPGGFRTTAVEGIVTQEGGVATGARPGGPLDSNRASRS